MKVEVNNNVIDFTIIIIDKGSFQAWGEGNMEINIPADSIKRIIVETNE